MPAVPFFQYLSYVRYRCGYVSAPVGVPAKEKWSMGCSMYRVVQLAEQGVEAARERGVAAAKGKRG